MRRIAALLLIASLAACTGSGGLQELAPTSSDAPIASGPRFADRDPHDWQTRKPWDYAIHGTDVSKYQTAVDWAAARAKGISFAFIKATEGGDRVDDNFHEHWRNARAAGIPRGAYHFFYFCRPAAEQAEWFIRNVPRERGSLPPVLDMEWNPLSPTCTLRPPPETVRSEMRIFLNMVQKHYGKRPIIYTTVDFHRDNLVGHFEAYPFWLRSVANHPENIYSARKWAFWQYTSTGVVPGISGNTDINVFAGSAKNWNSWVKTVSR